MLQQPAGAATRTTADGSSCSIGVPLASLVVLASLCPKISQASYERAFWRAAAARPSNTRQVLHKQERPRAQGTGAPNAETRDNYASCRSRNWPAVRALVGVSEVVRRPSKNHVKFRSAGRLASRPLLPCGKRKDLQFLLFSFS